MAPTDTFERAARFVQAAFDDEDLRRQLSDAGRSGGKLVGGLRARRQPPPQTLLQRANDTVRASTGAVSALRQVQEPKPTHPRRTVVALLVAGGLVAALAARTPSTNQGATHAA